MKTIYVLIIIGLLSIVSVQGQTVKVNEPAVCYQCHPEMETEVQRKNVHAAFSEGTCSSCHNPHATKHANLQNEEMSALCFSCHENFLENHAEKTFHQPLKSGDCLLCHTPHASDHASLLQVSSDVLCLNCHNQANSWFEKKVVHQPVSEKECGACHEPHLSEQGKLLKAEIHTLCFECHTQDASFNAKHKGDKIAQSNCITCHDPHASDSKGLIMSNQHRPFASGQCKSCHETTNNVVSFAVKDTNEKTCLKCHRTLSAYEKNEHQHIMGTDESCLSCHNPHASSFGSLLANDQQILCKSCHFNDNPKKPFDYYDTHPDTDCSACHEPHGSNDAKYLKSRGLELCLECHTEAHSGSHPLGDDVIDPRTKEPITCLSCHKLHGTDFPKYLLLDPAMDLCIQCHKR